MTFQKALRHSGALFSEETETGKGSDHGKKHQNDMAQLLEIAGNSEYSKVVSTIRGQIAVFVYHSHGGCQNAG